MESSGRFLFEMARDLSYRYPLIAREGWGYIALAAGCTLFANHYLGQPAALFFAAVTVGLIVLFRDPSRKIPASPLGIVSPVDGRVLAVATTRDPWLDRDAVRLVLSVSRLGTFSIRSPVEGKVAQQWYPGQGEAPVAKRFAQWIHADEGDDLVLVLHLSAFNTRPSCYVHVGERVGQGQRCGYLPFGSRLELFLPAQTRLSVKPGDRVRSGSDILATFVRRPA